MRSLNADNGARLLSAIMLSSALGAYLLAAVGLWGWFTSALTAVVLIVAASHVFVLRDARVTYVWSFVVVLVVVALATPSDGWDARSIWLFHAKRIYVDQNIYSQLDGYAPWSQNDYPSLVPFLMAAVARLVGSWNEIFPKAITVVMLVPALLTIIASMRTLVSVAFFLLITTSVGGIYLFNGYIDVLVALYGLAVLVLSVKIGSGEQKGWLDYFLLVLSVSTLLLLKNEAAVVGVLVGVMVSLHSLISRRQLPYGIVVAFVLGAVPLVCWKLAVSHHGVVNDLAGSGVLTQLSKRLPNAFFTMFVLGKLLGRLWVLVPVGVLVIGWKRWRHVPLVQIAVAVSVGYVGVLYFVYMSTPHDVKWHLQTSVDRTVMPISMILSYAALFAVDLIIRNGGLKIRAMTQ